MRGVPKYLIQTNLYSLGGEYVDGNGNGYKGYYHKYAWGDLYSEAEFKTGISIKLYSGTLPVLKDRNVFVYSILNTNSARNLNFLSPIPVKPEPTEEQYKDAQVDRYFLKKRNESILFEIDKTQFENYDSEQVGINQNLYMVGSLIWKLSGPKHNVVDNKGIVIHPGVIPTNRKSVALLSKTLPGLEQILPNALEYYR